MRLSVCTSASALVIAIAAGSAIIAGRPDVSNLPPILQPHRPIAIAAINGVGGLLIRMKLFGLPSETEAVAGGCKAAALPPNAECHLDMPGEVPEWREGLRAVLKSYGRDAQLTALGILIARGQIENWLVTRARLVHAWRTLPAGALESERIRSPIFIVGLPRTGTTFLLNLLKQDPRLRTPLHWELVEPIPGHGEPSGASHVDKIQGRLEQYVQLLPGIEELHPMSATMAEECVVTMAHEFSSQLFEATANVSSYVTWLLAKPSHAHVMRWHKRLLRHLQRDERLHGRGTGDKHGARASEARQWVLKTPWYLPLLDELPAPYPDALVIHTHRAPAAVVASSASVHAKTFGAGSDHINLEAIGAQQLRMTEDVLSRGLEVRRRWKAAGAESTPRVADVQLEALKADALGTVAQIYAQLGLELTAEARASMEAWLREKEVRHGGHKAQLETFGLSAKAIMKGSHVFRQYCEDYGVAHCDRDV